MVARLSLLIPALLLLASWLTPINAACADSVQGGEEFLSRIHKAAKSGDLTAEEALLCKFQYLFSSIKLPAEFKVHDPTPLKCGTPLLREFQEMGKGLSAESIAEVSLYLEAPSFQSVVFSPKGRFQLFFSQVGENAVPGEDVDPANGIPDYVERIGGYLDQAWESEILENGFTAPVSPGGPYPVSFQDMAAYGYTVVMDEISGATRIVLHNDFEGFPANDDSEGDRWGAAKVTAAHELKHASQYAASRWSEGGWIELDAVWAEELVFDEVNDYYNFLLGESPLRRPDLSLDSGITCSGSYEDAVFQIWLEQTWGVEAIRDFWSRRRLQPSESVITTWDQVLADRGVSFAEGWALFTAWNYGTDQRAVPGVGYDEAADYPNGLATPCEVGPPVTHSGRVDHLAAKTFRLDGFTEISECEEGDRLEIVLHGSNATSPLTLAIHITKRDGTGLQETALLDDYGHLRHLVRVPWAEIETAGVIVGNAARAGSASDFDLTFCRVGAPDRAQVTLDTWSIDVELRPTESTEYNLMLSSTVVAGESLDYTVEFFDQDPRGGDGGDSAFTTLLPWLTCESMHSNLLPGQEDELSLEFSAAGLPCGKYCGWLGIRTDGLFESGATQIANTDLVSIPVTMTIKGSGETLVAESKLLHGSYPNPFNPVTWIHFELPAATRVQVDVLDLRGSVIRRLLDGTRDAGSHRLAWNGRDDRGAPMGTGLYLARLRSGGQQFTCKMILAR
ncbi:MAG: T9SS type A sorting domain-containing protein [Gemmatimonadales bacterium]|nr:T9SS type A sorting domain-containing protein [Gemmatimonadales bacterium]